MVVGDYAARARPHDHKSVFECPIDAALPDFRALDDA
jgi:hypothetical protein